MRYPLAILSFLFAGLPALAHPGHLGELAGHGHWTALGAVVAAAALAALLAKLKADASKEDEADSDESEEETQPEPAGA